MRLFVIIFVFVILLLDISFAQQSQCDYKVEVLADSQEFTKENFTWSMKATKIDGMATNITGTAKIEDSNNKIVKNYKPWTSESISRQKTSSKYSPNLNYGEYKITAEISVDCNDTDKSNNADVKMISIKEIKNEVNTTTESIEKSPIKNEEIAGDPPSDCPNAK